MQIERNEILSNTGLGELFKIIVISRCVPIPVEIRGNIIEVGDIKCVFVYTQDKWSVEGDDERLEAVISERDSDKVLMLYPTEQYACE